MSDDAFITTIDGKTAVVYAEEAMDGGMVEFYDAVTGEHRGCAGIHWWNTKKHRVRYKGRLPRLPEEGRWL